MDYNLDYIRQQFKSYENNLDSEPGLNHLKDALGCAMEILETSKEIYNTVRTYLRKTIEKAEELLNNPSPNSIQLYAVYTSMESFIDCGFDDIPDCFMPLKGKILIQWVNKSMDEGKPSEMELIRCMEKEICEALIKSGISPDVAFKATRYIPTVRTHNGERPLTDNEKEEWCFYMKNKSG